jgi:hypothetical protein
MRQALTAEETKFQTTFKEDDSQTVRDGALQPEFTAESILHSATTTISLETASPCPAPNIFASVVM